MARLRSFTTPLLAVVAVCLALWPVAAWVLPWMLFAGWFDDPADGFYDASDQQLIAVFAAHRDEVERLRSLHREDRRIGAIGTDHIGSWWRYDGRWQDNARDGVVADRAAVVAAVGLEPARDAEYRRLFAALGAYRVRALDPAREGYDTEIHLTRRGNVVRSISKSFVFAPDGQMPPALTPRPGDPDEERFTPLGDGWFLRYIDH